ncbi:MAG: class I SAM-dependent methyltransferase [Actinomycetota bacterium]|nr:class I SAM-dependent methyltransferase [Actinomycetota bacterium]
MEFASRTHCPACYEPGALTLAACTVFSRFEHFPAGSVSISPDVEAARRLLVCQACALWYFSLVPTPETISRLLDRPGLPNRWSAGARRGTFGRAHRALAAYLLDGGRILDVGAHTGGFLSTLGPHWDKTAIEPMTQSEEIPDTVVLRAFLEDADLAPASFDCITAFDVLEHLHDPAQAIAQLAHALRPGGILVLETGTSDSAAARRLRGGWYYLNYLEHHQAFNRRAVASLLERKGFEVLEVQRVFHKSFPLQTKVRSVAHLVVFCGLTLSGRRSALWRTAANLTRRTVQASPPYTLVLEADHMFVVARKL